MIMIIKGFVAYKDSWMTEKVYQRYMDGYPEAMIPLLKNNKEWKNSI